MYSNGKKPREVVSTFQESSPFRGEVVGFMRVRDWNLLYFEVEPPHEHHEPSLRISNNSLLGEYKSQRRSMG
jgi:hypothetical protein